MTKNEIPSTAILVVDDLREFTSEQPFPVIYFKTDVEFSDYLTSHANPGSVYRSDSVTVILDHDAGGIAFGEDTFRRSIRQMCDLYIDRKLPHLYGYIVTQNPAGRDWIKSELERAKIQYDVDPGGVDLNMKVQWQ